MKIEIPKDLADLFDMAWKRFEASMEFKEPDRVPAVPYLGSDFCSDYAGLSNKEWYKNAETQLKTLLELYTKYPDLLAWPGIKPYGWPEISVVGAKTVWKESGLQVLEPLKIEEISQLNVPDPKTDGLMPFYLEMFSLFSEKLKDYPIIAGHVIAPFSLAVIARGITQFMADLYKHPEEVHELLEFTSEVAKIWLKAQFEVTGGSLRHIRIAADFETQISPKHYEEFAQPYIKKMIRSIPQGTLTVLHNCGNVSSWYPFLDFFGKLGIDGFEMGPKLKKDAPDIRDVKKKLSNQICLIGNVPPVEVLLRGSPKAVEMKCKELINKAAPGGGFCLSSGGSVGPKTPMQNIDAMISAAEEYGTYPISVSE